MKKLRGSEAVGVVTGVSQHNFSKEIRSDMDLPKKVIVNDLTLREGRQIEGVVLSLDELIRIANQLEEIGVPMVQLSLLGEGDYEFLKEFKKRGIKIKVEVFSAGHQTPPFTVKTMNDQIDRVLETGVGMPDLPFALSDDLLKSVAYGAGQRDMSVDDLKKEEIEFAIEAVQHAKSQGAKINVNLQDFMRCDIGYMQKFCKELDKAGVNVITLDDIAGPSLPSVYKYCVRKVKEVVPDVPIGIHVHNDFALALPGVLGALEGGAEVLDCGVNAYGERAGHCELAQLVVILEFLYGYDTGIKLERLTETAKLISDIMRQPLPKWSPITGDNTFSHLADWHWQHQEFPWAVASLAPEVVGNSSRAIFGHQVGPYGLRVKAKELGINIPDEKLPRLATALTEKMRWSKRPITDIEFRMMVEKL